ncbi:hypothetical protein B0H11DRAFT_2195054 [Mycena galericulata]|nr:hypothetical protein B0H11DRAFT_2195054 [Mycena galericulata]
MSHQTRASTSQGTLRIYGRRYKIKDSQWLCTDNQGVRRTEIEATSGIAKMARTSAGRIALNAIRAPGLHPHRDVPHAAVTCNTRSTTLLAGSRARAIRPKRRVLPGIWTLEAGRGLVVRPSSTQARVEATRESHIRMSAAAHHTRRPDPTCGLPEHSTEGVDAAGMRVSKGGGYGGIRRDARRSECAISHFVDSVQGTREAHARQAGGDAASTDADAYPVLRRRRARHETHSPHVTQNTEPSPLSFRLRAPRALLLSQYHLDLRACRLPSDDARAQIMLLRNPQRVRAKVSGGEFANLCKHNSATASSGAGSLKASSSRTEREAPCSTLTAKFSRRVEEALPEGSREVEMGSGCGSGGGLLEVQEAHRRKGAGCQGTYVVTDAATARAFKERSVVLHSKGADALRLA